jgi:RNA polymerase sigma-70 factor (ECF subfamily)
VFVIVQRKLPEFDGQNLGAWLYKIARNHASDYRRRAWMRRIFRGDRASIEPETAPVHFQGVPTPLEALQHREVVQFVTRTLNKMPVAQRSAFVLFEIEGYSGEEIAELEGIPVATVWTRVHYARKRSVELLARADREGKLP